MGNQSYLMNTSPPVGISSAIFNPIIGRQTHGGTFSLPVMYMLVSASLLLPFMGRGLTEVRWGILCAVATPWILLNMRWTLRPAISTGLAALLLASVVLRIASVFWSPMPLHTALRSISLVILLLFLVTFVTRLVATGRLRLVAHLIVLLAAVFIIPGTLLWLAGYSAVPWSGNPMWKGAGFCGWLGNPNQIGICLAVCLPVVVSLWWERKQRIWLLLLAAICLHSLFMAGSRAGTLGTILGVGAFFAVQYRIRHFPILAVLLVAGAWLLFNVSEPTQKAVYRYATRREPAVGQTITMDEIGASRWDRWASVWPSIKKRPILGQGYGVGGTGTGGGPPKVIAGSDYYLGYPLHNSYLQVWQENGTIGLLLVLGLVAMIIRQILKFFAFTGQLPDQALWAGLAGACIGGLADSVFESWLLSVGNLGTLPFWTCAIAFCSVAADRAISSGRSMPTVSLGIPNR